MNYVIILLSYKTNQKEGNLQGCENSELVVGPKDRVLLQDKNVRFWFQIEGNKTLQPVSNLFFQKNENKTSPILKKKIHSKRHEALRSFDRISIYFSSVS